MVVVAAVGSLLLLLLDVSVGSWDDAVASWVAAGWSWDGAAAVILSIAALLLAVLEVVRIATAVHFFAYDYKLFNPCIYCIDSVLFAGFLSTKSVTPSK